MEISDLMSTELIFLDENFMTQDELFRFLTKELKKEGIVSNEQGFINDLYKREEEISTGIQDGFGIPHAQSKHITRPVICFLRTSPLDDYIGLDEKPIKNVFLIGIPLEVKDLHLDVLSSLSRRLVNEEFKESIETAKTKDNILELMK